MKERKCRKLNEKKKVMPEGVLVTKTREMVGLAGKLGLDS